jgi:transposase InsO family protein
MNTITASRTIEILRGIFPTHGLPRKVVTDNRPTFTSQEFQQFLQRNGIKHITTVSATNGLAERTDNEAVSRALKEAQYKKNSQSFCLDI